MYAALGILTRSFPGLRGICQNSDSVIVDSSIMLYSRPNHSLELCGLPFRADAQLSVIHCRCPRFLRMSRKFTRTLTWTLTWTIVWAFNCPFIRPLVLKWMPYSSATARPLKQVVKPGRREILGRFSKRPRNIVNFQLKVK